MNDPAAAGLRGKQRVSVGKERVSIGWGWLGDFQRQGTAGMRR